MKVLSDLNESDLRHLFSIIERDHPDALASSLTSLLCECGDGNETNKVDLHQRLDPVTDDKFVVSDIDQESVTYDADSSASLHECGDGNETNEVNLSQGLEPVTDDKFVDVAQDVVSDIDQGNVTYDSDSSSSLHECDDGVGTNKTQSHQEPDNMEDDAPIEEKFQGVILDNDQNNDIVVSAPIPITVPISTPISIPTNTPVLAPAEISTSPTSLTTAHSPPFIDPPATDLKPMPQAPSIGAGEGCYLHYEASSAKLKLQYSKSYVANAIGFYSASTIPAFKFKKNFGRAELIGNCASGVQGRKNYYSGWCQFIRAARSALRAELECYGEIQGELYLYPRKEGNQGLDVDIYTYDQMATIQTIMLPLNTPIQNIVCAADAVACLPKHSDIFLDVKQMDYNRWLTEASNTGATSRMTDESSVPKFRASPKRASSLYSTKKFTAVSTKPTFPSKTVDTNALASATEEEMHVYTNPVKKEEEDSEDEVALPDNQSEVEGCYLLYDSDSCKLMLRYSKVLVKNAIGFYCAGPGHSIQAFKFKRNFGRAELIGNCASGVTGRKNFYSGWCQFIRAARAVNGPLWIYPRKKNIQGLDVDIYVYYQDPKELNLGDYQTVKLIEREKLNVTEIDAVACVPKFTDFFEELKLVEINRWLTEGNTIGATSRFTS